MPDEQNIQRIAAYIAQNRDQYDLDALRQQLLAAGYGADDVDAAIARGEQPQQPAPPLAAESAPPVPSAVEPQAPAPAAEGDELVIQRIATYLERNRQQYTVEALRQQLLGQGQRPELVEAAMARVQAAPTRRAGVVVPALPWAGGALALSLIGAWLSLIDSFDWLGFGFVATLLCGGLGILLILVGAVVQAFRRPLGLAMLFGGLFAFALSALAVVIFFGLCLVLLYQFV